MDSYIGQSSAAARQTEDTTQTTMRVRKRNGSFEPVDINKIVRAVSRCCTGLPNFDTLRVATKTISNTPSPLDRLRLEVVPPG